MSRDSFLVRADRVKVYERHDAWRYAPLEGGLAGDLWLTSVRKVGFTRTRQRQSEWEATLGGVTNASRVSRSVFPWCVQLRTSTSFEADIDGKRRVVCFTGITKFLSTTDRGLLHLPHGANPVLVGLESAIKNRGSKGGAKVTLELWLALLRGDIGVTDPKLVAGAAG